MKTIKNIDKDTSKTIKPRHKGYTPESHAHHIMDVQTAILSAVETRTPQFKHRHLSFILKIVSSARLFMQTHGANAWLEGVTEDFVDIVNDYYTETLPGLLLAYPEAE